MSPAEAAALDPQARMLLALSGEALLALGDQGASASFLSVGYGFTLASL